MNRHPLARFIASTPPLPRPLDSGEGLALLRRPDAPQPLPEANRSRIQAAAECYGWNDRLSLEDDLSGDFVAQLPTVKLPKDFPKDQPKEDPKVLNAAGNTAYLFQIGTVIHSTPTDLSENPDVRESGTPAYFSHFREFDGQLS